MLHKLLGTIVVFVVLSGSLLAADALEAVVVSYDKDTMKLVVKVGDKERTYDLPAKVHVHDVTGKEIPVKGRADKLKKGTKIEIEEKSGKVEEINIKK
jgi:hypothetical protein